MDLAPAPAPPPVATRGRTALPGSYMPLLGGGRWGAAGRLAGLLGLGQTGFASYSGVAAISIPADEAQRDTNQHAGQIHRIEPRGFGRHVIGGEGKTERAVRRWSPCGYPTYRTRHV
jgi:hypothetical protein